MAIAGGRERIHFGSPERGKEASARPPRGRLCNYPSCQTVLSTYNRSDSCWLHAQPTFGHPPSR
jgi:hypothetical protein